MDTSVSGAETQAQTLVVMTLPPPLMESANSEPVRTIGGDAGTSGSVGECPHPTANARTRAPVHATLPLFKAGAALLLTVGSGAKPFRLTTPQPAASAAEVG